MSAFQSWRWSALAVAFSLATATARAEMITPNSIPNPPSAVASAQGTPVNLSNYVNFQYKGLGLVFPGGSAITQLNGVSVWAPVSPPPAGLSGQQSSRGSIDYAWPATGRLVSAGSLNPTTTSSLTVEMISHAGISMSVYGINGQRLNINPTIGITGDTQTWTFTGQGISTFSAVLAPPIGGRPEMMTATAPWGVAAVSFTPATAPEPSSLVLAGLGALGLAARFGWRRIRRMADQWRIIAIQLPIR